jgi:hypothetical protein
MKSLKLRPSPVYPQAGPGIELAGAERAYIPHAAGLQLYISRSTPASGRSARWSAAQRPAYLDEQCPWTWRAGRGPGSCRLDPVPAAAALHGPARRCCPRGRWRRRRASAAAFCRPRWRSSSSPIYGRRLRPDAVGLAVSCIRLDYTDHIYRLIFFLQS